MPFKCAQCGKVVQYMKDADCECSNPYFVQCALIHYIHPKATGEVVAKSYNNQGASIDDEGFSKPITVKNQQQLRLACKVPKTDKRNQTTTSIMSSLVSCPDCLAFIEELKSRSKEE